MAATAAASAAAAEEYSPDSAAVVDAWRAPSELQQHSKHSYRRHQQQQEQQQQQQQQLQGREQDDEAAAEARLLQRLVAAAAAQGPGAAGIVESADSPAGPCCSEWEAAWLTRGLMRALNQYRQRTALRHGVSRRDRVLLAPLLSPGSLAGSGSFSSSLEPNYELLEPRLAAFVSAARAVMQSVGLHFFEARELSMSAAFPMAASSASTSSSASSAGGSASPSRFAAPPPSPPASPSGPGGGASLFQRTWDLDVDLWAAGALLYYLLSGRTVWAAEAMSMEAEAAGAWELRLVREEGMVDLFTDPWPSVAPGAKHLLARMLRVEPLLRATPNQVLGHEWISTTCAMPPPPPDPPAHVRARQPKSSRNWEDEQHRASGRQAPTPPRESPGRIPSPKAGGSIRRRKAVGWAEDIVDSHEQQQQQQQQQQLHQQEQQEVEEEEEEDSRQGWRRDECSHERDGSSESVIFSEDQQQQQQQQQQEQPRQRWERHQHSPSFSEYVNGASGEDFGEGEEQGGTLGQEEGEAGFTEGRLDRRGSRDSEGLRGVDFEVALNVREGRSSGSSSGSARDRDRQRHVMFGEEEAEAESPSLLSPAGSVVKEGRKSPKGSPARSPRVRKVKQSADGQEQSGSIGSSSSAGRRSSRISADPGSPVLGSPSGSMRSVRSPKSPHSPKPPSSPGSPRSPPSRILGAGACGSSSPLGPSGSLSPKQSPPSPIRTPKTPVTSSSASASAAAAVAAAAGAKEVKPPQQSEEAACGSSPAVTAASGGGATPATGGGATKAEPTVEELRAKRRAQRQAASVRFATLPARGTAGLEDLKQALKKEAAAEAPTPSAPADHGADGDDDPSQESQGKGGKGDVEESTSLPRTPPLPWGSLQRSRSGRERQEGKPPRQSPSGSGDLAAASQSSSSPSSGSRLSLRGLTGKSKSAERVENKGSGVDLSSDYMAALAHATTTKRVEKQLLSSLRPGGGARALLAQSASSDRLGDSSAEGGGSGRAMVMGTVGGGGGRRMKKGVEGLGLSVDSSLGAIDVEELVQYVEVGDKKVDNLLENFSAILVQEQEQAAAAAAGDHTSPARGSSPLPSEGADSGEGGGPGLSEEEQERQSMIVDGMGRRLLQSPMAAALPRRKHGRSSHVFC